MMSLPSLGGGCDSTAATSKTRSAEAGGVARIVSFTVFQVV